MSSSNKSTDFSAEGSAPVNQLDNLSPLAEGDQRLNRHLGYFSGTLMNGTFVKLFLLLQFLTKPFLYFHLVGQIIGTGIFSNPSLILQNCGSGGIMLILWVIGAIFAGTGVWCYLELGTMLPRR